MRPALLTSLMVLALLATTKVAHGDVPTPEQRAAAKEHYENGSRKFDIAKYDDAAQEFEAAYELIGDPVILYNIAQSYRLAKQYEKALTFYRSYLNRTGNPPNRAEVEKRIDEMTEVIKQQKHVSEAPPTGTLPSEAQETTPGTAAPSQPATPPTPPPQEEPPPTPPSPVLKYVGFAAGGLAVAALAVGGAMSGLAAKASSDVESASRQPMAMWNAGLASTQSNGHTYDTISYVGYAVGGAAAIAAGVALFLYYRKPAEKHVAVAPFASPTSAGLALDGRF